MFELSMLNWGERSESLPSLQRCNFVCMYVSIRHGPAQWFAFGTHDPYRSRLQLPLKLAWAVTIHKSQGLTLTKVVVDIGKKEFSCGLTFVACSRVCHIKDLLFTPPFPFQRLSNHVLIMVLSWTQLRDLDNYQCECKMLLLRILN